jgi:uncharacterized membrane protein
MMRNLVNNFLEYIRYYIMKIFTAISLLASVGVLGACSLGPATVELDPVTHPITAVGTEPFWSFSLSGNTATRSEIGMTTGGVVTSTYTDITQTTSGSMFVYSGTDFTALANFELCSDGMSDTTYPLTIQATKDSQSYSGCAQLD